MLITAGLIFLFSIVCYGENEKYKIKKILPEEWKYSFTSGTTVKMEFERDGDYLVWVENPNDSF